jgi:hypothetical protein
MTGMWITGIAEGPGPDPGADDYIALSVIWLVSITLVLYAAIRLRVVLSDDGVTVFGFGRRKSVAWNEVSRCWCEYSGLKIATMDGRIVSTAMFGRPKWRDFGIKALSTGENLADHLEELAASSP